MSGGTMENKGAFPLGTGDENDPHTTFGWQVGLNSVDVGLLSGEANTRPDIHTELHHLKAVIQ